VKSRWISNQLAYQPKNHAKLALEAQFKKILNTKLAPKIMLIISKLFKL
jgi:hypothetical protein